MRAGEWNIKAATKIISSHNSPFTLKARTRISQYHINSTESLPTQTTHTHTQIVCDQNLENWNYGGIFWQSIISDRLIHLILFTSYNPSLLLIDLRRIEMMTTMMVVAICASKPRFDHYKWNWMFSIQWRFSGVEKKIQNCVDIETAFPF